eukprot:TRINITY_DN85491_c0_g1_i1.p1 TRINITY_DN85491_c0_g1~~TRINITY_DN85491_c0_g1_i1.p1  ORF type:complete len:375 (-),score=136.40 TRINITY_DN85491_c0_g1_i1:161-1285(-)
MSLLASETQTKINGVRAALHAVERHLEPLLAKSPVDVTKKLAPLENAELQVGLGYTVASLYFAHLLTQGVDPAEHPIKQELDRLQLYFKKLKTTKEEIEAKAQASDRMRVDAEAAQRALQHYAAAAEAVSQRRSSVGFGAAEASAAASAVAAAAKASAAEAAPSTKPPAAPKASAAAAAEGTSSQPSTKAAKQDAKSIKTEAAKKDEAKREAPKAAAEAEPAAKKRRVEEQASQSESGPAEGDADGPVAQGFQTVGLAAPPSGAASSSTAAVGAPKAKAVIAKAPPSGKAPAIAKSAPKATAAKSGSAAGPQTSGREPMAYLVPMEPAGADAHATAASLVAKGKADAARRKKKKAEKKAAAAGAGTEAPAEVVD